MKNAVTVSKVQYAEFFRLLFERYASSAKIEIDGETFGPEGIELLKSMWCTRRKIRDTQDFRLWDGQREVASFHDSVDELFISVEEVEWLRELNQRGILRFRVLPVVESPSLLRRFVAWISSAVSFGRREPTQPLETTRGK